jgi:hypothetical protein
VRAAKIRNDDRKWPAHFFYIAECLSNGHLCDGLRAVCGLYHPDAPADGFADGHEKEKGRQSSDPDYYEDKLPWPKGTEERKNKIFPTRSPCGKPTAQEYGEPGADVNAQRVRADCAAEFFLWKAVGDKGVCGRA